MEAGVPSSHHRISGSVVPGLGKCPITLKSWTLFSFIPDLLWPIIGCAHETENVRLGVPEDRSTVRLKENALEFDCSAFYGTTAIGRPAVSLCRIALLRTKIRTFIYEEISLLTVLYFPFRVLTPNSQNNTDHPKLSKMPSDVVNDKGRQ